MKPKYLILFLLLFNIKATQAQYSFSWAKSFGSTKDDNVNTIKVDAAGNSYIFGAFQNTVDFDPGPQTHTLVSKGNWDFFILKLNSNGDYQWVKQIGSSTRETPITMTTDSQFNLYISGSYSTTLDFDPGPGTYTLSFSTNTLGFVGSPFILKLDNNGNFAWVKNLPSQAFPTFLISNNDSLYFAGDFTGNCDFDPGISSYSLTSAGNGGMQSAYVCKWTNSGDFVWAISFAPLINSPYIYAYSTTTNFNINQNTLYLSFGARGIIDLDPGPNTNTIITTSNSYTIDLFLLGLTRQGKYLNSNRWIGDRMEISQIETDKDDNKFIQLKIYNLTYTPIIIDLDPSPNVYTIPLKIGENIEYIIKLDKNFNLLWSKSLPPKITATPVKFAKNGFYVYGGFSDTTDFDLGPGTYTLISQNYGSGGSFIANYDYNGNLNWVYPYKINYSYNNNFYSGNISCLPDFDYGQNIYFASNYSVSCDVNPLSIGSGTFNSTGENDFFVIRLENSLSGLKQLNNNSQTLMLYPNPTAGVFNLSAKAGMHLRVYDVNGKQVFESLMADDLFTLDLSQLDNGLYFVNAQNAIETRHCKLLIEK